MKPYVFNTLKSTLEEIRLLDLLPGKFDDSIHIRIYQRSLTKPPQPHVHKLTLDELRSTLPPGWDAYENVDSRYIFCNKSTQETSWAHPNVDFDCSEYENTYELPPQNFEPKYEALSYVWGPRSEEETVIVEDPSHSALVGSGLSTFLIGKNLAQCLRYLREPDVPRTLWVDAICSYSHRTATKHLGTLKFAPQVFEGFNFTHLVSAR